MDDRNWLRAALIFGIYGVFAIYIGLLPGGANRAEKRLEQAVAGALTNRGFEAVDVAMEGQKAILSGRVASEAAFDHAISAARSAAGPGGALVGGVTAIDSTGLVIAGAKDGAPYEWQVAKSPSGDYVLSGSLPSRSLRRQLKRLIETEENALNRNIGPVEITDRTNVSKGAPSGNWIEAAGNAIRVLATLESGVVNLSGADIAVAGDARDEAYRAWAIEKLELFPGGYNATHEITIAEMRAPYALDVVVTEDNVSLSGDVADLADRVALIDSATQHFSDVDSSNLGNRALPRPLIGAEGYGEARSGIVAQALPVLKTLGRGALRIRNRQVSVEAPVRDEDGFTRIDALMTALRETKFDATQKLRLEPGQPLASPEACNAGLAESLQRGEIKFPTAKSTLDPSSARVLDRLALVMRRCPDLNFEIAGHTDNVGNPDMNMRLSEARAEAIFEYLTSLGVPASQLEATGYGDDRPVASNKTPEGRAQNRRIEITLKR